MCRAQRNWRAHRDRFLSFRALVVDEWNRLEKEVPAALAVETVIALSADVKRRKSITGEAARAAAAEATRVYGANLQRRESLGAFQEAVAAACSQATGTPDDAGADVSSSYKAGRAIPQYVPWILALWHAA